MPEPDFKMPTVYSRPKLSFGLTKTTTPYYPTYGPPSVSSSRPKLTLGGALNGIFGRNIGYKTHDEYALDAVNNALSYPQVNTPTIDAGSSVMNALKGTAAAILANMGSTGDGAMQARPVAYSSRGEHGGSLLDSPVVLIGLVLGAGALIYAVNK